MWYMHVTRYIRKLMVIGSMSPPWLPPIPTTVHGSILKGRFIGFLWNCLLDGDKCDLWSLKTTNFPRNKTEWLKRGDNPSPYSFGIWLDNYYCSEILSIVNVRAMGLKEVVYPLYMYLNAPKHKKHDLVLDYYIILCPLSYPHSLAFWPPNFELCWSGWLEP